jgi:hypothetical protein
VVYIAAAMSTFEIACWALVRKPCIIGKYWPYYLVLLTRNPTIYNIICWFAGPMGQTTPRPSVWRSKYFFFRISYRHSKLFIFIFVILKKNKKINWKGFCKIILGTSDTWSTSLLSHRPSKPAYYTVDWRIYCAFDFKNSQFV